MDARGTDVQANHILSMIVLVAILNVTCIVLVTMILSCIQGCGAGSATNDSSEGNRAETLKARALSIGLCVDVGRKRKWLLLVDLI